jgi:hypothetical protein
MDDQGFRVRSSAAAFRPPFWGIATWAAWVLAGAVGNTGVLLALTAGWFPVSDSDQVISACVGGAIIGIPQYLVLRLSGRPSLASAMWIPVTMVAWLAYVLGGIALAGAIADGLYSVDAVRALRLPVGLLTLQIGAEFLTLAALVGAGQGLLLSRVVMARSAVGVWVAANLLAAVVVGIAVTIRDTGDTSTNQSEADVLLSAALVGGIFAAVTGVALVALARRARTGAAPRGATEPAPAVR